jgi:hypothetical protein
VRPPYTTRYDVPAVCTASIISGIGVIPSAGDEEIPGNSVDNHVPFAFAGVLAGRISDPSGTWWTRSGDRGPEGGIHVHVRNFGDVRSRAGSFAEGRESSSAH